MNYQSSYTGPQIDEAIGKAIVSVPQTRTVNAKPLSTDVVLDATDIGARPSDWMPTAADVGARADDWLPTLAQVGGSKGSLLHNWYWADPINQKAFTSQNVEGDNIDRWWTYSEGTNAFTLTVNSGYISISATTHWVIQFQRLEKLPHGTYTLSVKLTNGSLYSVTINWAGIAIAGTAVQGLNLGLDMSIGYPMFYVQVMPGYSFDIVAVKLEEGGESTLAYDTLACYTLETIKCQRFYEVIDAVLYRSTATAFGITVPYKVTKRIAGTTKIVSANNVENNVSYFDGVGWTDVPVSYKEDYIYGVFVFAEDANLANKTIKFKVFADATL